MKIILLSDIAKLGKRYDVKDVSAGHANNLLIPKGLAMAATTDALKRVEAMKKASAAEEKVQDELLARNFAELDGKTITVKEKVNEKGHLFAGIHKKEIAKLIEREARIIIDPDMITLDQPIKEKGEHPVVIQAGEKRSKVTILVEEKK